MCKIEILWASIVQFGLLYVKKVSLTIVALQ